MEFYNYLITQYGYNEAIIFKEIQFNEYSKPWLKKSMASLCKEERLIRYDKGIYYIPTETVLGKSKLDPRKLIMKKYIKQGDEAIGYFSGTTFMNMLGLSTQMPNVMEIYTNNEKATVRKISIGKQNVRLRRARTDINNENVQTMSFLELMNSTDASFYDDNRRQIVADFIEEKEITRKMIAKYSPYFPDKAMRTMIESEMIYHAISE